MATVSMPMRLAVRITRHAISPRFATSIRENIRVIARRLSSCGRQAKVEGARQEARRAAT